MNEIMKYTRMAYCARMAGDMVAYFAIKQERPLTAEEKLEKQFHLLLEWTLSQEQFLR